MKKLFTFLMLAAFVVMGFAQQRISPIDHEHYVGNISSIDRSDWYGSFSWESGFRQTAAEDAYYLVIDADEIPAGAVLEKVYFIHVYNASISCTNTAYTINLYRNPSVDDQGHLNPGESIFSQDYTAPMETDAQQVPFTTPYTVVAGESLCIGIVMDGTSYIGLGTPDSAKHSHNFARFAAGNPDVITSYIFGDGDTEEYDPMPFSLAVYYNDGQPYVNKCDLVPTFLDPEEDGAVRITSMAVKPDLDDALYCKMGVSNDGIDMFYGDLMTDIYIDCPTATEPAYFLQADTISAMDSMLAGYIYSWQPIALFTFPGNDDPDYTSWEELQEMGYDFPFELCMHITYTMASDYNCIDNNANNDTYCITVTNANEVSISENTNTLTVSPNPASTILTVENAAGAQISVYNIAGQEVMSVENAEANETLNVSNLNAGLYIVRVVNGNEVSTAKVSIVR